MAKRWGKRRCSWSGEASTRGKHQFRDSDASTWLSWPFGLTAHPGAWAAIKTGLSFWDRFLKFISQSPEKQQSTTFPSSPLNLIQTHRARAVWWTVYQCACVRERGGWRTRTNMKAQPDLPRACEHRLRPIGDFGRCKVHLVAFDFVLLF